MDRLNARQAAEFAGVKLSSWDAMVSRGYAPHPDGREGIRRWWHQSTLEKWKASRPGQGGPGRPRERNGLLYVDTALAESGAAVERREETPQVNSGIPK